MIRFASGTLDVSALSQYNSRSDIHTPRMWTEYFISDQIKLRHSYGYDGTEDYIQLSDYLD